MTEENTNIPPVDTTTPPATPPATPPQDPPATPPENTPPELPQDDNAEPPVRASKADTPANKGESADEEFDPLDPKKTSEFIDRRVEQKLNTIQQQVEDQRIEAELNAELTAHPEYKPYEARIRRWVNHDNRKSFIRQGFPVSAVITEAISPYLQQIGAEKVRKADEEAKTKEVAANQTRPATPPKTDFKTMPVGDFKQVVEQVKSGRYTP